MIRYHQSGNRVSTDRIVRSRKTLVRQNWIVVSRIHRSVLLYSENSIKKTGGGGAGTGRGTGSGKGKGHRDGRGGDRGTTGTTGDDCADLQDLELKEGREGTCNMVRGNPGGRYRGAGRRRPKITV